MNMKQCPLCKKEIPELLYDLHMIADNLAIQRMQRDFPDWSPKDGVCEPCLERYKKTATSAV